MKIYYLILIVIVLVSCNSIEKKTIDLDVDAHNTIIEEKIEKTDIEETQISIDKEDFLTIARQFIQAFNDKNIRGLSAFIHDDYGITGLYNPGAFHVMCKFKDFNELLGDEGGVDVLFLSQMQFDCEPQFGEIPVYDCDSGWSDEGCFWSDKVEMKLLKMYEGLVEYDLMENDDEFKTKIANIGSSISNAIYSTESVTGFYFGMINEKWYLLCIDRIDPCSA